MSSVYTTVTTTFNRRFHQRLDQLLRCGICYDFVKTALMTPCSHNFCSLCIRKYMQYKTSCPACLIETVETQLKNNRVLDELVKILERLKPSLCKALSGHELGLPTSSKPPEATSVSTVSEKPTQNSTEKSKFIQIEDSESSQDYFKIQPKPIQSTKSIFSSTNNSVTTTQESSSNSKFSETVKILENNVPSHSTLTKQFSAKLPGGQEQKTPSVSTGRISPEVVDKPWTFPSSSSLPASPQKPAKRTIVDMFKRSPVKKSGLSIQRTQNPVSPVQTNHNMVSCPVCSVSIPNIHINQHLDVCLKNQKVPPQPSTKVTKSRQPLAKPVYRLLKDKDLKLKLTEHKLNNQGDRKTMEKRYQRYLVLYNSECDKADPRPVPEIVRQLEREEREENLSGCKTYTMSLAQQVDRKSDPKEIERAQKQYLSENKSSFDALIASMKQRKAKKVEPPSSTATSSSDTSNLAPSSPTASTSAASGSSTMQPSTSEVKEKSFKSSTPADQEAPISQDQSNNRQGNSTSPSLLSPVYGLRPQSPSLLSQNTHHSPSVKSPILGKKRLFPPTEISTPPALDAVSYDAPILISDDSNSTVFSEGDLSQIDIAISQHNSSATEVKGDNNSAEFSCGDFAHIDNAISQHNSSAIEIQGKNNSAELSSGDFAQVRTAINHSSATVVKGGENNSAEYSSGDFAQIDNAISQHMNKSQMAIDEDPVDPWEIPVKPTGHKNCIYDSSDSDEAFQVQRRRSAVPLHPSPVAQRQRRSRKRQVPEQSNEPRRSSRKKPKSK